MRNNIFQLGKKVDVYRVVPSNDLEENLNFHITDNIFVNVDAEEFNDVLIYIGHTQIDEDDDSDEINVEDCVGDEDESINKE